MNENFVKAKICESRGYVAFDVGANHGIYTRLLAERFKKVYAFEPVQTNVDVLRGAVEGVDNVTIVQRAVSDDTGETSLCVNPGNQGGHTIALKVYANNPAWSHIVVPCVTIDDFCKLENVAPDLIKMDIEGAEDFAWDGAIHTLTNHDVKIILEVHDFVDVEHLWNLFRAVGYVAVAENNELAHSFVNNSHYFIHRPGAGC